MGSTGTRRSSAGNLQPERIGRYRVLYLLGVGGMGEVYLCKDEALDRLVAVKRVTRRRRPAAEARLRREARALARLNHPNVVQIFDTGEFEGRTYIAMEYVEGPNLREWLERPRGRAEILQRFIEAGRGLAAAHDAGLVHRDFKPDNVLLGDNGILRVADFGLAVGDVSRSQSLPSTRAGTRRYMAPEQLVGGQVDPRSDQFAFCVSLYEALWGELPVSGPEEAARALRRTGGLRGSRGQLDLYRVIRRGLAHEPDARWPSMTALLEALAAVPRRRRRLRRGIVTAGVAALVFAAYPSLRSPASSCSKVETHLHGTWDAEQREWLRARLEEGPARVRMSGDLVIDGLDRWSTRWIEQRQGACERMHDSNSSPDQLRVAGAANLCLDRQREQADATVKILLESELGPEVVALALAEVSRLDGDSDCMVRN